KPLGGIGRIPDTPLGSTLSLRVTAFLSQTQPLRVLTSVNVTAAFAKARPTKLPRVSVIAAPERMFPLRSESVCVAAASDHQITLHACPPPAMTTEKLVPVKAPVEAPSVTLNVQLPVAGPLS